MRQHIFSRLHNKIQAYSVAEAINLINADFQPVKVQLSTTPIQANIALMDSGLYEIDTPSMSQPEEIWAIKNPNTWQTLGFCKSADYSADSPYAKLAHLDEMLREFNGSFIDSISLENGILTASVFIPSLNRFIVADEIYKCRFRFLGSYNGRFSNTSIVELLRQICSNGAMRVISANNNKFKATSGASDKLASLTTSHKAIVRTLSEFKSETEALASYSIHAKDAEELLQSLFKGDAVTTRRSKHGKVAEFESQIEKRRQTYLQLFKNADNGQSKNKNSLLQLEASIIEGIDYYGSDAITQDAFFFGGSQDNEKQRVRRELLKLVDVDYVMLDGTIETRQETRPVEIHELPLADVDPLQDFLNLPIATSE